MTAVLRRAGLAACEGLAVVIVAPLFWGVPHRLPPAARPPRGIPRCGAGGHPPR